MPSRRSMDFYYGMAASMVWNERRTDESYLDAAKRCAEDMAHRGLEDVDPQKVLDWAVDLRADRIVRNGMQTIANQRCANLIGKRPVPPDPTQEQLDIVRDALRAEIQRIHTAVHGEGAP